MYYIIFIQLMVLFCALGPAKVSDLMKGGALSNNPFHEGMRNPQRQHKPPINPQLIYDLRIIYDEVLTIDQPKYSSLVFGVCFLFVRICIYIYIYIKMCYLLSSINIKLYTPPEV